MINLSDKLTAKTVENILGESKEIGYIFGDANPRTTNTVAGALNEVKTELLSMVHAGDIVGNPTADWKQGTVEEYVDNKILEQNIKVDEVLKAQQMRLNTLNGNEVIVVNSLPSSGSVGIIYRVPNDPDEGHYSDYMWDINIATPAWKKLASYTYPGLDEVPTSGSANFVKSGGVFDEITTNGSAFDVTVYNSGVTYASLSEALNAVPTNYKKGGMSIKYVQSSDNKYVQYRLISDSWSANTEDWAITDECVYIEDPEFIYVKTDAEGKILLAIKVDGSVYYGAGVPQQVVDYIEEKISSLSLDEYEDIVAFLSDYIGGDATLKTLLDSKLDVEGLDPDALETLQTIENPEYIQVTTDSEGRMLGERKADGIVVENCDMEIEGHLAAKNGLDVWGQLELDASAYNAVNDIEDRLEVKTDNDGKIISYIAPDGTKVEEVGIITPELEVKNIKNDKLIQIDTTTVSDTLYCEKPKYAEMWFEGILPTDMSEDRIPTWLDVVFKINGIPHFRCKCTLAIQGHGSASFAKKGYTFEPYNADGEAINIKFGDMVAVDSFHMKAYPNDNLHCRDIGGYNIWRTLIHSLDYPYSKVNNIPFALTTTYNKDKINLADAEYCPDGFPIGCYLNGDFLGLYTIKHKKTRQNYAMEKSVKDQVFLDAINYQSMLNNGFNPYYWELKNPKIKNYEEGGIIPDAEVMEHINHLFDWLQQFDPNDASTYSNYADYIVLPHWLTFIIFTEVVMSIDSVGNNINLMTWDGNKWSIIPWDLDQSVGLFTSGIHTEWNTWILKNRGEIWDAFETVFETKLRALYTKLRQDGIIETTNIVKHYLDQCAGIPRDVYAKDMEEWGCPWEDGIPSTEQLYITINNRINWLDQYWLNN